MFIPYRIEADEYDQEGAPWITYTIIAVCFVIHMLIVNFTNEFQQEDIYYRFGCTPAEFRWWNTLSCTLLHGGLMHLFGNLYFLWIYGPLCEKVLGKIKYLALYIIGAVVSVGGHCLTVSPLFFDEPCIGASGAISAVLGAFLVLFPTVKIRFLVYTMLFPRALPTHGPAWFVLGCWFIVQLLSSLQILGGNTEVAFWAHAFGFVAGAVLGSLYMYLYKLRRTRMLNAGMRMLEEGIELDEDYMRYLDKEGLIDSGLMRALSLTDPHRLFDRMIDEWRQSRTAHDDGKAVLCYYLLLCRYGPERLEGDTHAWSAVAAVRLKLPALSKYAYFQAISANDGTTPKREKMLRDLALMLQKTAKDPEGASAIHALIAKHYPNADLLNS